MLKYFFMIAFGVQISEITYAQIDTTYYDMNNKISNRELAKSFMTREVIDNNILKVYYDVKTNKTTKQNSYFLFDTTLLDGFSIVYDSLGFVSHKTFYTANKKDGIDSNFYIGTNKLYYTYNYLLDALNGNANIFYENGKQKRIEKYSDNKLISEICFDENSKEVKCDCSPFKIESTYPGGDDSFIAFIENNLIFPDSAIEQGIQGTVRIEFEVDVLGVVGNYKIISSVHPLLDKEAMRVVKLNPQWIPERIDCKLNKTYHQIPIAFHIFEDDPMNRKEWRRIKRENKNKN